MAATLHELMRNVTCGPAGAYAPASSVIPGNGPALRGLVWQVDHQVIDVTITPALRRVVAFDDGMIGSTKMLGGVLAWRLVATADMAARPADAQVKPDRPSPQTVFAAASTGRDFTNGAAMAADRDRRVAAHFWKDL
jgi:hypothetical protein